MREPHPNDFPSRKELEGEIARLRAALEMAENRLEAALLGDEVCKDCVEVAQSYLQAALQPKEGEK